MLRRKPASLTETRRSVRVFIDCEFTHLPWTGKSTLLWAGLCDEDGQTFSAIAADTDLTDVSPFVRERVLPLIPTGEPRLARRELAEAVREFCAGVTEFWAWQPTIADLYQYGLSPAEATDAHSQYADWDLQLLRDLTAATEPAWQHCHDLHTWAMRHRIELPINQQPHHPGSGARWGRAVYQAAHQETRP